jgi:drug/metabolite transporter (DMT)-like permease
VSARVRLSELTLLYCAAIWGSTFYVVRDTVATVHPLTLVGWRFTLAAALLLPVLLLLNRSPGAHWRSGALLGAIIAVLYAAQTYGLLYTTAANSAFITGLFVIFVPPFAFLMHRTLPMASRLLAVALAVAGLLLLTGGPAGLNRGDLLTLIAAATYAWHVLLTGGYMERGLDPLVIAFQQLLVCGVLSLAAALLVGAPLTTGGAQSTAMVLFLALLPTLSAYLLQLVAQRHVDAVRTALIFTMEPVFGAVFAWTLGGELLVPLQALGGLLIVVAMLVSELSAARRAPSAAPAAGP